MSKILKFTFKFLAIVVALGLVLFGAAILYVSLNKKEIISYVTTEVGNKLNGKLVINDVELSFFRSFPEISVLLRDLSVSDTMIQQHQHPIIKAEEVFVNLNILKLLKKQPPLKGLKVQGATVYLFTDSTGYTNTYLFRPKRDSLTDGASSPDNKNELKSVLLKNVRIVIEDRIKDKFHDLLVNRLDVDLEEKDSSSIHFSSKADISIKSLAFNLPKGSFLKDAAFKGKFEMRFNKQSNQLLFDDIQIKLSGHPFKLSGTFDLKGDEPQFALKVQTHKIHYDFVKSLLPPRIAKSLSIVDVDKPIDADATISGPLKGGEPLILVNWATKNTHVKTPFLDFENASFAGYYTNEVLPGLPRNDANSKIEMKRFSADWHKLPLTSYKIEILDLTKPILTCDLGSEFPLTTLSDIIGSSSLKLKKGTGSVQVVYKGPIEKNNNTNSFLNGAVSFKDAVVLYTPRNVEMKEVNGKLTFRNSNVFVENLQCNVLDNRITMQGEARNLLTLINTEPSKINIDWNISTPLLNLNAFTYLLQKRKNNKTAGSTQNSAMADMAAKIDNVLEMGKLQVSLKAGKLLYKNFEATNTEANITLLQDSYIINQVSMMHAGGHIYLKGSLLNQAANNHKASINVDLKDVNVSKVFTAFGNFGQDGITDKSLEGKLTAKADATMSIDENGALLPSSVVSTVDFSLKDGALINYEPIKKLQRFIFKNRDFDNIRFAELKNRFEISNQEIKIHRMEIQSTVMSMFVEGLFSNKGNTDMSIQVPLNNLKKRGVDYNPENIGTDKKGGGSIFIRGRPGDDGTIKFKLDLFNKYDKEKESQVPKD